ncbi:condensation domain-containing protein [Micromonospora sp. NPDC003197]
MQNSRSTVPRRLDPAVPAYADFHGERATTAPLTWGQRAMWRSVAEFEEQENFLNLRRVVAVPRRVEADVQTVSRVIGQLVGRHESLRTRVEAVDDELRQRTFATGRIPLLAHAVPDGDADPEGRCTAQDLADRLGEPRFDHADEWPLRAALVTAADRVRQIVLVFSHSTVDFHAVEIILRDLRLLLLRGRLTTDPGLQSVDVARREQQVERRRSDRAIAYWVRQFRHQPPGMLTTAGPELTPRYRKGSLASPVIDSATRLIAARHRVSTGTVLLTAIAAASTAISGESGCGIVTMANNRFQPAYDDAISKLNQLGFCALDLTDQPNFTELLSRTRQASLDGYRHAYYDPAEMQNAFAQLGLDFGTVLAPYCYVNDIRLPREAQTATAGPDEATVRAMRAATTFTWTEAFDRFAWRCRIQVVDAPGAVELVTTADTRYLPPDQAERFLLDIEELLVDAAFAEGTRADLS